MSDLLNDANRDRFLTARWNNILTLSLGLPTIAFAVAALTTDSFTPFTVFVVLVVIGAFY